jgi:hypothetical protein
VINVANGLATDKEKTYEQMKTWVNEWDGFIKEEKQFCKSHNINLIVSDMAPQPFIIAKELGLPSVAITNFTWHCIYSYLFSKNDEHVKKIKEAYLLAGKA